jgi:hypothetical protein
VTSLRPALVPMSATQPLLVVDLQPLGPEYMYSVVDVYDRPIPGDMLGRPESLAAIARRLREIFPNRQVDSGAAPAPDQEWIWLIDGTARAQAQAVAPITRGDSAGTASSTSRAKAPDAAIALAGARSSSSCLRMEGV